MRERGQLFREMFLRYVEKRNVMCYNSYIEYSIFKAHKAEGAIL